MIQEVATELVLTPDAVDQGLFADLKSEQRLTKFKDLPAERLLQRYNVALAQAVLLRSTGVDVIVRNEPPQRYRQLLRRVKFHRLVCEVERLGADGFHMHLDGPMSLFSATQKYGLQLAVFLPAVLLCRDFELKAEVRWGPQCRPKTLLVTPADGLVSHYPDQGMYTPPELAMFVELFRKRVADWDLVEEPEVLPLGDGFWAPDFRLVHKASGLVVYSKCWGSGGGRAPSSTWNGCGDTCASRSCWRCRTSCTSRRPTWRGCRPAFIASAICPCRMRSPGWRGRCCLTLEGPLLKKARFPARLKPSRRFTTKTQRAQRKTNTRVETAHALEKQFPSSLCSFVFFVSLWWIFA